MLGPANLNQGFFITVASVKELYRDDACMQGSVAVRSFKSRIQP